MADPLGLSISLIHMIWGEKQNKTKEWDIIFFSFFRHRALSIAYSKTSQAGVDPTKFFSPENEDFFRFFATKLGRCTVHTFFSYATNSQA